MEYSLRWKGLLVVRNVVSESVKDGVSVVRAGENAAEEGREIARKIAQQISPSVMRSIVNTFA